MEAEKAVNGAPELSVVLVTDGLELITEVLGHLGGQTVSDRIELILASPPGSIGPEAGALEGFHSVQVVDADTRSSPPAARAAGVQVARAPLVVFSETHCFPEPDWAEVLIAAHRGPWAAVGPVIVNENPEHQSSWANIYVDYAAWLDPVQGGPVNDLPGHNSSYKRSLLLTYGDDLARLFESESILHQDLRSRGQRLYLETRARVHHRNMTQLRPATLEHFHNGRCYGALRSRDWSAAHRALYAAASPLIPLIRLNRILREVRRAGRQEILRGALPGIIASLLAHAAGEMTGYVAGPGGAVEGMADYELDRDIYTHA